MLLLRSFLKSMIGKAQGIKIKDGVVFDLIPAEALPLFWLLMEMGKIIGVLPTITGADQQAYREGGAHQAGYAWDIRISDIPQPAKLASFLLIELRKIDSRYVVLYGDKDHLNHIHVHWQGEPRIPYKS